MTAAAGGHFTRLGGMLQAPRRTLAALDAADAGAGMVGDATVVMLVRFLATELPVLVTLIWAGVEVDRRFALVAVLRVLQTSVVNDLIIILGASAAIWVAAGARRRADKDVELGTACWVPYAALEIMGWLVRVTTGRELPGPVRQGLFWVALAWGAVLVVFAVGVARRRTPEAARP
jgi:hypothetical protein